LTASIFGICAQVIGVRRRDQRTIAQGTRFAFVILGAAVLAFGVMERALITRDFTLAYVQKVGARSTPALYNVTAIWTSLEGSILLWLLILGGYTAAVAWRFRQRRTDGLVGWATAVLYAISAFFFFLTLFPANPFKLAATVKDGVGPNPLLQNHVLVLFHPPMLYLGYVGMSVPFAFAIAALVTGRLGEGWLIETRRWTLFAWAFLTVGILLGGWWSYEVLGWGGVWGWDAVENASFLPWLTGTAYIHSVMVQERRGMLRVWNLSLLVATFSLTILGTFLTRSGIVASVHSFSQSSIGPFLLGFFGVIVFGSLALIAWRGDRLRSPGSIDSPISREGAFLANNVLFGLFAFVILLGTVYPLLVEAVQSRKIAVGSPYFDQLGKPIGIALLFMMAVAPALPWRKASTEVLRQRLFWPAWGGVAAMAVAVIVGADGITPLLAFGLAGFAAGAAVRQLFLASRRQGMVGFLGRANGGMVVHLGVILVAVGLVSSNSYSRQQTFQINPQSAVVFAGHRFEYRGFVHFDQPQRFGTKAMVAVDGQVYAPATTTYKEIGQTVPTPSVDTGLTEDIYLVLEDPKPTTPTDPIRLTVAIKPMIAWLWIGGSLMACGTALAAFPGRRRRRGTEPASAPITDHRPAALPERVGADV
jgi:cytochrome c-type biogenesis protein CcmF